MSLKNLLGEEKWNLLQKKTKDLGELHYIVVCETCGQTFFDETLAKVQEMMQKGEWDPHLPQLWFVEAGRHWVHSKYHSIRVFVISGSDRSLIKDLSQEWTLGLKGQKIKTDKAMLAELDNLEKQIRERKRS